MGKNTIMYGLRYIPDLGSDVENNRDFPKQCNLKVPQEFSFNDHEILRNELLIIKETCNVIVEIGVARNEKESSTYTLLNNKRKECIYLGIDINDKSFLVDKKNNIYTMKINSSNVHTVMKYIEKISGKSEIDFLFIDGWHSVNQVVNDWNYTKYLSKNGVVLLHDTNVHQGPVEIIKAVDRQIFSVKKYFEDKTNDWGITVVKKLGIIYIAHRGNVNGPDLYNENKPSYILKAINNRFNVEIDVYYINGRYFLGHTKPTYEIEEGFLFKKGLWIHAKNIEVLYRLYDKVEHIFFHEADDVVLTSDNYLWTFVGKQLFDRSIAVMPENTNYSNESLKNCSGICSDHIRKYKEMLG